MHATLRGAFQYNTENDSMTYPKVSSDKKLKVFLIFCVH